MTGFDLRPVLGTRVDVTSPAKTVDWILACAAAGESRFVAYCTVHMIMEAFDAAEFRGLLAEADLVNPDGLPLVWMQKLQGARGAQRTTGPDTLPMICEQAARDGVAVGFYGATPETLVRLTTGLRERFPALRIAYEYSPPFRALTDEEDEVVVREIVASGARVVFVGLGCPRQERWCHGHRGRVPAVLLAVGAAFDFHAGSVERAPVWMQRIGLEWLHRLAQEPRRLAWRYLAGNSRFVFHALLQLLGLARYR